jgi:hypothetical protein
LGVLVWPWSRGQLGVSPIRCLNVTQSGKSSALDESPLDCLRVSANLATHTIQGHAAFEQPTSLFYLNRAHRLQAELDASPF